MIEFCWYATRVVILAAFVVLPLAMRCAPPIAVEPQASTPAVGGLLIRGDGAGSRCTQVACPRSPHDRPGMTLTVACMVCDGPVAGTGGTDVDANPGAVLR